MNGYKSGAPVLPLEKFEILVKFNNGNRIEGEFEDAESAVKFLEMFQTALKPVVVPGG